MPKYNVSLKCRFQVQDTNTAEAIKNVIYVLTNNFEDLHGLEITQVWELKEKAFSQHSESEAVTDTPRTIGL